MTSRVSIAWKTVLHTVALLTTVPVGGAATPGSLRGSVTGPSGSALPGVVVTALREGGANPAAVVTGEGGEYRIDDLDPGVYRVEGALRGFHSAGVSQVVVTGASVARVDLSLQSATFSDTIDVDSTLPPNSLEAAALRESGASDAGEALAQLPGVWKSRRGGIANDVVLRGFRQDDIAVLIDGARVAGACPNRMDPPAFHFDFAEVDRIEVVPAAGRMTAQGSMGGLVNVVTKKPARGLHADVSVAGGSFDLVNPSATVSYGDDRFGLLGGMSRRSSSPYEDGSGVRFTERANYDDEGLDADAFDVATAWFRTFLQPAEAHEISLSYARQEADGVLYPTLMMDAAYDDTDRLVLAYRYEPASGGLESLRITAYGTRVEHWMTDSMRVTSASAPRDFGMGTFATTGVFGASAEADLGQVIIGAEVYSRRWDAWTELAMMGYTRQYSIPDVDMTVAGAYARWRRRLSSSTHLELGGRVDRVSADADEDLADTDLYYAYHGLRTVSRSDVEPSASLELVHTMGRSLTVSGSLATTTRSPDPRERFFALRRMGGDWVGNPGLEPPRTVGAELELSWDLGTAAVTAVTWLDEVDGFITLYDQPREFQVPGVMNPRAKSYGNVDATLRGASVRATAAISSRISWVGQVSYVRGTKEPDPTLGLESRNLAEMPPLTGRLAVRWQNTAFFAEIEGVGAARQDRVDADLDESPTAGYGVANLRAGSTFGRWRLQLMVENLFDHTFHEHFSYLRDPFRSGVVLNEPGRRVVVSAGWNL